MHLNMLLEKSTVILSRSLSIYKYILGAHVFWKLKEFDDDYKFTYRYYWAFIWLQLLHVIRPGWRFFSYAHLLSENIGKIWRIVLPEIKETKIDMNILFNYITLHVSFLLCCFDDSYYNCWLEIICLHIWQLHLQLIMHLDGGYEWLMQKIVSPKGHVFVVNGGLSLIFSKSIYAWIIILKYKLPVNSPVL